jgi:outer membrane protein assembly factor BamB
MKMRVHVLLAAVWLCAPSALVRADDWPQWRGPERNDISHETGLLKSWPTGGPPLVWTFTNAGAGYSGPAIVGNHLLTMGALGNTESVFAIDVLTGKKLWATAIGDKFSYQQWGDGPRGTPTVDGPLLYALGGQGNLVCLESATGKKRWQVSMQRDLGGKMLNNWGYTESPLVDGEKVICSPGGPKGTIAALNKITGKVIWRSKELTDVAAYSSAIVAEAGSVRQYVELTGKGVAGVAADDGRLLWHYIQPAYRTAVIPTAIFHDGFVYATSGYGAGCNLIQLMPDGKKFEAVPVYANKKMTNHHGGVVLVGDHLYGYSESEHAWICQDFKTGDIVWSERKKLGKGSLTCADGHLVCYSENDGTAVLIAASPEGWKESGRFTLPRETSIRKANSKIWTHPVIANGRLFLRDQDLVFCFDVREHTASRQQLAR